MHLPLHLALHGFATLSLFTRIEADRLAASNAELVKKVVDACEKSSRRIATPAEARQILGLRPAA